MRKVLDSQQLTLLKWLVGNDLRYISAVCGRFRANSLQVAGCARDPDGSPSYDNRQGSSMARRSCPRQSDLPGDVERQRHVDQDQEHREVF
jgi:hypothetical protein